MGFSKWRHPGQIVFIILLGLAVVAVLGCRNVAPRNVSAWTTVGIFLGIADYNEGPTEPKKTELSQYVGAGRCVLCHAANYYVWQQTTKHAQAFQALEKEQSESGQECLRCHGTGLECSPCHTVKGDDRRLLEGVQCENCHGPGSNHTRGLSRMPEPVLSAEACGCHSGRHSAALDEWRSSRHALSLADLKDSKEKKPEDSCLRCHSADVFDLGEEHIVPRKTPILETANNPITCMVCHEPHKNKHGYQLRKPREEICNPCHSAGEGIPRQQEMLAGTGARLGTMTGSGHFAVRGVSCVTCHMHREESGDWNRPDETGHDFDPHVEECMNCHQDGQKLWTETQMAIKSSLAVLRAKLDTIDPSKLDAGKKRLYEEAEFDYDFVKNEGSFGIHNKAYADSLIRAIKERLDLLE